jgi:hypothetical protein
VTRVLRLFGLPGLPPAISKVPQSLFGLLDRPWLLDCARQGRQHARYRGTRKNLFDVRRAAAVLNLEVIDCRIVEALPYQRAA